MLRSLRQSELFALVAGSALLLFGCASPFTPPAGYVRVRDPRPYEAKAVSATGRVIALRSHANEDRSADLRYWSDAVEHQKTVVDGMRLVERSALRSDNGRDGTLFVFENGEGDGRVAYWVALFVTPDRIRTVECVGPSEGLQTERETLLKTIRAVR